MQRVIRHAKSQIDFLWHLNKTRSAPTASKTGTAGSGTTEPDKEKLICVVFQPTIQLSVSLALDAEPIGHV